jgi:hypothetical protein
MARLQAVNLRYGAYSSDVRADVADHSCDLYLFQSGAAAVAWFGHNAPIDPFAFGSGPVVQKPGAAGAGRPTLEGAPIGEIFSLRAGKCVVAPGVTNGFDGRGT